MTLRRQVIRLAFAKPELREHLLPLLQKVAAENKLSPADIKPGTKVKNPSAPADHVWKIIGPAKGTNNTWEVKGPRGTIAVDKDEMLAFWTKATETAKKASLPPMPLTVQDWQLNAGMPNVEQAAREMTGALMQSVPMISSDLRGLDPLQNKPEAEARLMAIFRRVIEPVQGKWGAEGAFEHETRDVAKNWMNSVAADLYGFDYLEF